MFLSKLGWPPKTVGKVFSFSDSLAGSSASKTCFILTFYILIKSPLKPHEHKDVFVVKLVSTDLFIFN